MGDGESSGFAEIIDENLPKKRKNDQEAENEDDFDKPGVYTRFYHIGFVVTVGLLFGIFLGMYLDSFVHERMDNLYFIGMAVCVFLSGVVIRNISQEYAEWPLEMLRKTQILAFWSCLISIVIGLFTMMLIDVFNHVDDPTNAIVYAAIIVLLTMGEVVVFSYALE